MKFDWSNETVHGRIYYVYACTCIYYCLCSLFVVDLNPLYNVSDTVTAEIVVAVSIVDLRVYANMAQFMGNAQ